MALKIEEYGLIGDCQTVAVVGTDGSIDWLCWPDFSSPACFAALMGTAENGRWQIAPVAEPKKTTRQYRDGTLILETRFETETGAVLLTDFMPLRGRNSKEPEPPRKYSDIIRIVTSVEGNVEMQMELLPRFDYGRGIPWTGMAEGAWSAYAGPSILYLRADQPLELRNEAAYANFTLHQGEAVTFVLTYGNVEDTAPQVIDVKHAMAETEGAWAHWKEKSTYKGPWKDAVVRSLITLKALTYRASGGIVAAATTSLPEVLGADRNWDYRFCWLRDGALTLESLISMGYTLEAEDWQRWLMRSIGSDPEQMQIMYGIRGDRHLPEFELPWLNGYADSLPVRVGNAASEQAQLDVYGEVADALFCIKNAGIEDSPDIRRLRISLAQRLTEIWQKPSSNIWEQRNYEHHFTYSKVMAWVGMNRTVLAIRDQGLDGPIDQLRKVCDEIHAEVCERGFDAEVNSFVQYYGADTVDASCLLIPIFGFLPWDDPRILGTIERVEKELMRDGLLMRFSTEKEKTQDSCFLACSFWLVECYARTGRRHDAEALFGRLLKLQNDVGLLAEEYDTKAQRALGNFPQALSHIALINAARALEETA